MGGTYPDAGAGETNCASAGNAGTAFTPDSTDPYRRTCYNPAATTSLEDVAALHPVRCYSPSLGYGDCGGGSGSTLSYVGATALCEGFAADARDGASDWRLPYTVEEAGTMCGSGCGFDSASLAIWFADLTTAAPSAVRKTRP